MSWVNLGVAAISAAGSYASAREQSKGLEDAAGAFNTNGKIFDQIDLDELDKLVQSQSRENIEGSRALEREFDPFTAAMRELFPQQIYNRAQDTEVDRLIRSAMGMFEDGMGEDVGAPIEVDPLFTQARDQAEADLAMGGELPIEIQNLIARTAAGKASQAGTLGTGLGRDLAARDLGLTALDLRKQRQENAANIGSQATTLNQIVNQFNAGLEQQNRNNRTSNLSFLEGLGANRRAETAAAISRPAPQYGLDPASIADLYVSDVNSLRDLEQQRMAIQAQLAQGKGKAKAGMFGDMAGIASGFVGSVDWGNMFGGSKAPKAPANSNGLAFSAYDVTRIA